MSFARLLSGICVGLSLALVLSPALWGAEIKPNEFAQKATWKASDVAGVREAALAWLAAREIDEPARGQVAMLWASAGENGNEALLLDLVCATFAAADPQAAELVSICSQPRRAVKLPDVVWLADEKTPAIERNNLRLLYGRWLVEETLFDEAATQLADLAPAEVVDPAALLFYQSVVHHSLLEREAGLAKISRLLENEKTIPRRFVSLARLMQADLDGLKDETLDHIARRMDDIRRRLDLGRAGPKVVEVEDGVIASLDKLIKKIEDQQQAAAAAAAAGGGGGARPGAPLPDSMPIEQKGKGDVVKKPVGDGSGWGQLPAKDRQEALQQIGNDFPAHYRDMIEQYFRKLATEGGQEAEKK